MKPKLSITLLIVFMSMLFTMNSAFGHVITVGDASAEYDPTNDPYVFKVDITVTNPTDIAAAAFTIEFKEVIDNVEYDTEKVVFDRVESVFFETFSEQWQKVPITGVPTEVQVPEGGETYDQPILESAGASSVKLAGAQAQTHAQTGESTLNTLFTLYVKIETEGTYKLNIKQTTIDNVNAGYNPNDAQGSTDDIIPYLVGIDYTANIPLSQAYPAFNNTSVNHGTITVTYFVDNDGDGMDDNWEIAQFGSTQAAYADEDTNKYSDHDQDGYTDLQEYLYSKDPGKVGYDPNDPDGVAYDPWVQNADDGVGYSHLSDYWNKIELEDEANGGEITMTPEAMLKYNNSLIFDLGANYGTYKFDMEYGQKQLSWAHPSVMGVADLNDNGRDQLAIAFDGYELYIYRENEAKEWEEINNVNPDAMIRYGNKFAFDYGAAYGLWTFDDVERWSDEALDTSDPDKMVAADVDSDGEIELVVSFGSGLDLYDNSTWTPIETTLTPESMIAHGNAIVADFGDSGGLKSYNTSDDWTDIGPEAPGFDNPSLMLSADIDDDGTDELIVGFENITNPGLYRYDPSESTQWLLINDKVPEGMIQYGKGAAIDFGVKVDENDTEELFGLYLFYIESGLVKLEKLTSMNPGEMVSVDIDKDGNDELAVSFPSKDDPTVNVLYIYDENKLFIGEEGMAVDFGRYGLYLYDHQAENHWTFISSANPGLIVPVDIDVDGNTEPVVMFPGYNGTYIWDEVTEWSDSITTVDPENYIKFGNRLAVDFGVYGLYFYDQNGWSSSINSANPSNMVPVDIDQDGTDELVVIFRDIATHGTYIWDEDTGWETTSITSDDPENIVRVNNDLAVDFGSQGFYLYDRQASKKWTSLSSVDPGLIVPVDIDEDSKEEIITMFPGYNGTYIWDKDTKAWSASITTVNPENIIRLDSDLAVDFGNLGLYVYNPQAIEGKRWQQISWVNPGQMIAVNIDEDAVSELAVILTGYGVYIWDRISWWGPSVSTVDPENIIPIKIY